MARNCCRSKDGLNFNHSKLGHSHSFRLFDLFNLKTFLPVFILAFFFQQVIIAQGDILWTRTFGGLGDDEGFSVQQTQDGGYIILGSTYSYGSGSSDAWLIKVDAQGEIQWNNTYGSIFFNIGISVQQTSDGGYILSGTDSTTAGGFDVWLIRTNEQGDTLWTRTYGGFGDDYGYSVQQTQDWGYLVVGHNEIYGGDAWLIKTNTQGDTLWTRTYGGSGDDYGYSILQAQDGGYIVLGYTESYGSGGFDVWLIKTDEQGDTLWTRTFGGSGDDYGYSVQQTRDGGYIICGKTSSYQAGNSDIWLIKTDPEGNTLWTRAYGGSDDEWGRSVQQTSEGGYIIAGFTESYGTGGRDIWLIKTVSLLIDSLALGLDGEQSDSVQIFFSIYNPNFTIVSLQCEYSVDLGNVWVDASVIGDTSALTPSEYQGFLIWNSYTDLPGIDQQDILFRITPYDEAFTGTSKLTDPFHLDNNRVPSVDIDPIAGEQGGDISISFQVSDLESDTLGILCEYYEPNFEMWKPATIIGDTSSIINYNNHVVWNSLEDLSTAFGYYPFRIIPYDKDLGNPDSITIELDNVYATIILADLVGEQSGEVEIAYAIQNPQYNEVNIDVDYSINGGQDWHDATVSGPTTNIDSSQYVGIIIWQSDTDLPHFEGPNVRIRITPSENQVGFPDETGDFHLDNNLVPSVTITDYPDTGAVEVRIDYTLADEEKDTLSLSGYFSTDNGQSWQPATLIGRTTGLVDQEYSNSVTWLVVEDLGFRRFPSVRVVLLPSDNDPGVADTSGYIVILNYPADFTGDLVVDPDDLALFAAAWNADPQDVRYEIGPATGEVPELIPQPDGVLDFEDLAVFIQMWNWSFAHNGFGGGTFQLAKSGSQSPILSLEYSSSAAGKVDGIVTVEIFLEGKANLMMMDGVLSIPPAGLKLVAVEEGEYFDQYYATAPFFSRVSADSSAVLLAAVGLGSLPGAEIDKARVATLRFRRTGSQDAILTLEYRLRDTDAAIIEANRITFEVAPLLPGEFALYPNYPNPFNPNTTIRYDLPERTRVTLVVYDLLGREVRALVNSIQEPGYKSVVWNGVDDRGKPVGSGIYLCRFSTEKYSRTMKLLLVK
jgi:hypothetical protein